MSCASVIATIPPLLISWRTRTNMSGPWRPCFCVTSTTRGDPCDIFSYPQRAEKFQPTARKHSPRERHRRNETSALGMPIWTEFRLVVKREKVKPVPQERQPITRFEGTGHPGQGSRREPLSASV